MKGLWFCDIMRSKRSSTKTRSKGLWASNGVYTIHETRRVRWDKCTGVVTCHGHWKCFLSKVYLTSIYWPVAAPPPVLITWRRSGAKFSILGAILVSSGAIEVTKLRALEMSSNKGEHESWVTASDSKAISKKKKHCHLGTYFLYNLLTLHLIFSGADHWLPRS